MAVLVVVLLSGCLEQGSPGHVHSSRGVFAAWIAAGFGAFGTLFPDIVTNRNGEGDRSVTRMMCLAFLFAGSVLLAGYYFDIHVVHTPSAKGS
ncbi:hypothetical protein [Sphingomonas sp. PB4P5]|uniref:hypothetical protein n=1 Tax=Parasphingomonas puruogangriensis TaxID=3096155 RepID=UPI002FCA9A03